MVAGEGACVVARWGMRGCHGGMRGCQGACVVARGHAWLRGGGCGGHAWWLGGGLCGIRRDTINERAVRILLECILVRLCNNMMISFQKGNSASSL